MKLLNQIVKIINKYDLKPIDLPYDQKNLYTYLEKYPEKKDLFKTEKDDFYFIEKYGKNIVKGHYGFSIGTPIIPEWNEIIDEILELCIKTNPNFGIMQIKIKFGIMHFYCESDIIEDLIDIETHIMRYLQDKALVY